MKFLQTLQYILSALLCFGGCGLGIIAMANLNSQPALNTIMSVICGVGLAMAGFVLAQKTYSDQHK